MTNKIIENNIFKIIESWNIEYLKQILKEKETQVNILNENWITPLVYTIINQNSEMFELLIERDDIDVNLACSNGFFPLLSWLIIWWNEFFEILLNRKDIDINKTDSNWNTILELSVKENNIIIFEKILNKINTNNLEVKNPWKLLELAIMKWNIKIIETIFKIWDLDINKTIWSWFSYLTLAIFTWNLEVVKILLTRNDIDINIKYNWINTIDFAKWFWDNNIIKLIENYE